MKIKELKVMNDQGLDLKVIELKKELMKAGSQIATGTAPKSPGKVKEMRRTIAQILTIKKTNAAAKSEKTKGGIKKE